MPIEDPLEPARQACLKRVFGGALSVDEELELRRFLATPEGREYRRQVEDLSARLKEAPEARPVDAAGMTRRFEEMMRTRARGALRLTWAGAAALLLWAAMAIAAIARGPGFAYRGCCMLLLCALFGWVGVALRKKNREMLEDPNLVLGLRREQRLSRRFRTRLNGWIFGGLVVGAIGLSSYLDKGRAGLLHVLAVMSVPLALVPLWLRLQRRRERELWDWWEGSARP